MMKTLACVVLVLVLALPDGALAQVSGGTGTVGYQLGVYGRVRVDAPVYPSTRQLDRLSFIAALSPTNVFDYTQDAQNVELPSRTTGGVADTIATVLVDNTYSHAEPDVNLRVNVYSWHGDDFYIVKYTVTNTHATPYTLSLGAFAIPKPSNVYGGETVSYDATKKVSYFFRTAQTPHVGLKLLSGDPSSFHVLDWDAYSPDPNSDAAADSTRYQMTAPPGFDGTLTAGVNGSVFNLNAGAWTLAAGASATVYYAVIFTNSLSDLLLEADSAQVRYNYLLAAEIHDIGVTKLREQLTGPTPGGIAGDRRANAGKAPALFLHPSSATTENAPVLLNAVVQNSGSFVENSYQIGWEVDGVPQTPVNNIESLTVGDADTVAFVWPVPTAGLHLLRAWTILGTDPVSANDTSGATGVFITPPYTVFEERFNGTFPPAGWTTINRDGSIGDTTTGPWAQGSTSRFLALEGTDNGFAGDAYTTANGLYIDDYLITPNTGTPPDPTAIDSLIFFARSYESAYPDSMEIRVSATGTDTADFTTLLDYINVPKTGWTRFAYRLPITGARYVAFRYLMYNGGSAGDNSVYLGVDAVHIVRHATTNWTATVNLGSGWNMVSNPVITSADSMRQLFPQSSFSYGFGFSSGGGYAQAYQLEGGKGYWSKMAAAHTQTISGGARNSVTVPVSAGWNMIGSLSAAIDTSIAHVTTIPPGLRSSNWFKYKPAPAAGYNVATDILPGYAYWVKVSGNGTMTLNATDHAPSTTPAGEARTKGLADLQSVTVTDALGNSQTLYFGADPAKEIPVAMFEMPPAPPEGAFDVRFGGGMMVQTLTGDTRNAEFPISINGAFPVTITWNVHPDGNTYALTDDAASVGSTTLAGEGSLTVRRSGSRLLLRAVSGDQLPTEFSLAQNFPNPFNPATTIAFALPVAGRVTADVYDILGRHVKTLVDDVRPAGYHSTTWDGTNAAGLQLGSGTYFLRLQVNGDAGKNYTNTRKMMLMK